MATHFMLKCIHSTAIQYNTIQYNIPINASTGPFFNNLIKRIQSFIGLILRIVGVDMKALGVASRGVCTEYYSNQTPQQCG